MNIIRPKKAAEKLGIGLPTLWSWARRADFPKPIQLSSNASGFVENELDDWLARRVAESRAQPKKRETAIAAGKKSALARRQRKAQEADHAPA